MTEYPINIVMNVSGQGKLQQISQTLQYMRQEGATTAKQINTLVRELNSINSKGFSNIANGIKEIQGSIGTASSEMQSFAKSINNVHGEKLNAISKELQTISKTSSQTAANVNKINFKGLNSSVGTLKSIDSTLKQLLTTVESLRANGNIKINVSTNARAAQAELQGLNNVRTHGYRTGSRNGYNYYGFSPDNNLMYQKAAPITQVGRNMQRMGEKVGLVGANLMMASSFLGVKELSDTIIQTPAKAEVQKYLLTNMQGGASITAEGGGSTTLYKTLDQVTDQLPISMQNVVQPLYAFKAASGASAQELNDIIPEFANFGAQVINMTGSEDQAEEAMQKLSRAYQGQYAAVDQYGITKESLAKVGYQEGGTIEEFMAAVTKITGDAKQSMNNFNGMKALVGKDFSRAGKQLWSGGVGQVLSSLVGGFHGLDQATGGFTTQLLVAGAGIMNVATTLTTVIGSIGTTIGTFGQMYGNLQAIRKNGGGLLGASKGIFSGVNSAGIYGLGTGVASETIDNAGMEAAVYEGAFAGTSAGMGTAGTTLLGGKGGKTTSAGVGAAATSTKAMKTASTIPPVYATNFKTTKGKTSVGRSLYNKRMENQYNLDTAHKKNFTAKKNQRAMEANLQRMWSQQDNIMGTYTNQYPKWYRNGAPPVTPMRGAKFGRSLREMTFRERTQKRLNAASSGLTRGFGKLSGVLSGLAGPTGLLLFAGLGLAAKGWVDTAAAHSQGVKDARTNLNRAFDNVGNSLGKLAGNFLRNIGLTNVGGTEGLYQATEDVMNKLALILNDWTGNNQYGNKKEAMQAEDLEAQREADRTGKPVAMKSEEELYGAKVTYNPDTKSTSYNSEIDRLKAEAGNHVEWWGNGKLQMAKMFDFAGHGLGFETTFYKDELASISRDMQKIKDGDERYLSTYSNSDEQHVHDAKIMGLKAGENPQDIHERSAAVRSGREKRDASEARERSDARAMEDIKNVNKGESTHKTMNDDGKSWLSGIIDFFKGGKKFDEPYNRVSGGAKGTKSDPVAVTNADTSQGQNNNPLQGAMSWLSGLFGNNQGQKYGESATAQKSQLAATPQGQGQGQGQSGMVSPYAKQIDTSWITNSIQQSLSTMDFSGFQLNLGNALTQSFSGGDGGGIQAAANQLVTQLQTGFNTAISGASFDVSGLLSSLQSKDGEFNSAGNSGGSKYKSGVQNGISGTSGIAQGEADAVVAALRSSIEGAREAGAAAGRAYKEGYKSEADINSPGIAARLAQGEANYLVSFLENGIAGAGRAGMLTASAYTTGITALTNHTSSGLGVAENISGTLNSVSSTVGSIGLDSGASSDTSSSNNNRNVVINNTFNIDKIDSKERVREIAETLVHIMTFNNETAGRNTDVGL